MEPRLLQAASSVLTIVMPSSIAAVAAQISASMTPAASNALKEDDRLVLLAKAAEVFSGLSQFNRTRYISNKLQSANSTEQDTLRTNYSQNKIPSEQVHTGCDVQA
eukprot:6006844-Amphidinium_carterae.2